MEILVKALRFLAQWGASTGLASSEHYVDRPYPAAWSYSGAYQFKRRCCMIQLRREWGRFSNFSFRTPQRRISAYPARPSG